ncbi:MAG: hypothetical protein KH135_03595 [Firmicutes bacterium]|nr:hypothetical protein [Bacillota bacterium]
MKKYGVGIFIFGLFFFCGCEVKKEELSQECTLWSSLEFYDTSYVTGIYTKDNHSVSKLHMTSSYSAKWDDVDVNQLLNTLNQEKETITSQYDGAEYEIHRIGNNVTVEQELPITKKNLNILKKNEEYQKAMNEGTLSINLYRKLLSEKGYQCQIDK